MYDAWGKVKIQRELSGVGLATANPFLWRGYLYDHEIGIYYLQSRYYDPNFGRFINPDEPMLVGVTGTALSCNLYAYCENDPINNVDYWGYVKINIKWLGEAIDTIVWLIPALYGISKLWKNVSKSASQLAAFGDKLISAGKKLFKRFDDRLYCAFAKDSTYRIIKTIGSLAGIVTIVKSLGTVVEYIIDILDSKWDGYLDTKHINPKFDFTQDY